MGIAAFIKVLHGHNNPGSSKKTHEQPTVHAFIDCTYGSKTQCVVIMCAIFLRVYKKQNVPRM